MLKNYMLGERLYMLRIKPQTKRKIAGIVAFLLALILVLSSFSVLFVGNSSQSSAIETTGGQLV